MRLKLLNLSDVKFSRSFGFVFCDLWQGTLVGIKLFDLVEEKTFIEVEWDSFRLLSLGFICFRFFCITQSHGDFLVGGVDLFVDLVLGLSSIHGSFHFVHFLT